MFDLVPFKGRSLARRSPWNLDNLFGEFFNEPMVPVFFKNEGQMKVDIREDEGSYIVEAELPGVNKEDINLEFDENILTISVEKNEEIKEEQKNYIRRERYSASTRRSFAVDNILADKITADFENGVLTVKMPKKEETPHNSQSKRISIN